MPDKPDIKQLADDLNTVVGEFRIKSESIDELKGKSGGCEYGEY